MTTKEKKQAFLLTITLTLMLIAGLALFRSTRSAITSSRPQQARAATSDSLESIVREPVRFASVDSNATTRAQDSAQPVLMPVTITLPGSAQVLDFSAAPALSDTLRRYGAHATTMQMLIELLEEKQLLMEEKVELSRRLEIAEILDSALIHTNAPNYSSSLSVDSLLSHQLDSLASKLHSTQPDSLLHESAFPPLE